MVVGLAKEIKKDEYRVGLTPAGCREYLSHGHTVIVERGAWDGVFGPRGLMSMRN